MDFYRGARLCSLDILQNPRRKPVRPRMVEIFNGPVPSTPGLWSVLHRALPDRRACHTAFYLCTDPAPPLPCRF